ncbi:MAG: tripartite tricarboxylate transporter TctB family protein [Alicyclobacillus macrosporangiidus]|uniref:tripartite tricarboxylate transporter TctB family protein n=1 Tax=Alicyclobacillus macrosporangiidus TaxID=392015 RepID=UPI0026EA8CAB|nr:tripartite tricarboxylate transporter TctB family protein [Alicyclobacillus macrosporangiidus]MCL6598145.1 tripartite tricarboxylate transporter TctB family protein [Alicyclobacillus macrosporangiidus]
MKSLRWELILDISWVAFAIWYVAIAQQYPPAGRLIPTVVGVALGLAGLCQLFGNFFEALRPFTHERKRATDDKGMRALAAEEQSVTPEQNRRELTALGWAAAFVLMLWLIGFDIGIPLYFLIYFLVPSRRSWKLAFSSAVIMGALTYGVFDQLLDLHLFPGVLFQWL